MKKIALMGATIALAFALTGLTQNTAEAQAANTGSQARQGVCHPGIQLNVVGEKLAAQGCRKGDILSIAGNNKYLLKLCDFDKEIVYDTYTFCSYIGYVREYKR